VIDELLVALRDPEYALSKQVFLRVAHLHRITRIREKTRERSYQPWAPISLAQEQHPAIPGNIAPSKLASIFRRSKMGKPNSFCAHSVISEVLSG
jgi:hypothetical protein